MKATKIFLVTATALLMNCPGGSCRASDGAWAGRLFRSPMEADVIFRGQSQDGGVPIPPDAQGGTSAGANGTIISEDPTVQSWTYDPAYPGATTWNAFSPPVLPDPFIAQPGFGAQPGMTSPYAPYAPYQQPGPAAGSWNYGANAAQPYRFGWTNRIDLSLLPQANVSAPPGGATGDFRVFGVDYDLAYSAPYIPGWVVNWTNQFAYRNWDGPSGAIGLPSDVFRFGIDLEFETPQAGPFSLSLGVNPSINTDFASDVWDEGFMLDGRGIVFLQVDQYWTIGLGAMYWDRVDDIVIPYAGLIYRDDYWEWQLMWPEAKISLFLGNEAYWSKWLYVRGEYHVEAYGVERRFGLTTTDDRVQLEDYRILIGMKMDSGWSSWFLEGGWVFARDVKFDSPAPGFDLETGFVGYLGLRY